MFRIALVLACLIILVLVIKSIISTAISATVSAHTALGDQMPKSFQNIAYVVLILLMFGVVTGFLGGL